MANGHGGARPGAGRKRNSEKYAEAIAAISDRIAADFDDRYTALQMIADGGFEQITETWEPAGLIEREEVDFDVKGQAIRRKVPAFPDLPPDQLVCIRRTRSIAAPDRQANQYLIDRLAGRPTQAIDAEVEHNAGESLIAAFGAAVAKIYGSEGEEDGG